MAKDELRQRVASRLRELGRGSVDAAQRAGLERNYIRDFLEGKKRSFSQANLPKVADALDWPVTELMDTPQPSRSKGGPRIVRVSLLDEVAAGKLASPMSQIPVDDVPLLAFADLGRGDFFALKVKKDGDSMDRVSPEGSIIVVNRADRELITGKYYVFAVNGETTYKRWPGGEHNYLEPYSTNPANKPIFYKRKADLEVIGRVKRTVLDL